MIRDVESDACDRIVQGLPDTSQGQDSRGLSEGSGSSDDDDDEDSGELKRLLRKLFRN